MRSDLRKDNSGLADGDPFSDLDVRSFSGLDRRAGNLMDLVGTERMHGRSTTHYRTRGNYEGDDAVTIELREIEHRFGLGSATDIWFDDDGRVVRLEGEMSTFHGGGFAYKRLLEVLEFGAAVVARDPSALRWIDEFDVYEHAQL